jgi:hypothetical protein
MKRALLPLLAGMTLLLGEGCGTISTEGNDAGGGTSGAGQAGSGAAGSGGSTGSAGAGGRTGAGGQGGDVACGPVTCSAGLYCCNAACGICAPPGGACVQGCPVGGQGGGAAGTSGGGGGQGGGAGHGGGTAGTSGRGGGTAGASGHGGGRAGTSGQGGGRAGTSGQGGGRAGTSGQGGGTAGTSGQGGAGGATCAELVSDYAAAMTPARACTPGATGQCQVLVSTTLSSCTGCSTYVNEATTLNKIRTQWTNQGCAVPVACPPILCIAPGPTSCVATDSGAPGGTCTITLATTN